MIHFPCSKWDDTKTPIVEKGLIWSYAEEIVRDYKPSLLREPQKINAYHFLESYLGVTIDYQDIFYAEGESYIAGATAFNDEPLRVFDKDGFCVRTIEVKANTIILDNQIMREGKEALALFTALHEAGHYTMHREAYWRSSERTSETKPGDHGSGIACCTRNAICGQTLPAKRLTPREWREKQANAFAAFAAMPRQTFKPYAQELIRKVGIRRGPFVISSNASWEEWEAHDQICRTLASTYGTSFMATKYHLWELKLIMSQLEFEHIFYQR